MKKQWVVLTAIFVALSFLYSSCDKNSTAPPKTKTELLTQGSWTFKSATVNGSDASAMIQACQKDNIYTFAAAGTGNVNEGATKCNASDPDNIPFTWNFQSSETVLAVPTIFFNGGNTTFQLESLTETSLVVSQGFSSGPGPVQNVVITFQH